MKKTLIFMSLALLFGVAAKGGSVAQIYEIPVKDIQGKETNLRAYQGKVVLVVNTASECGFTPQYAGLESLYKKYSDKGFTVLGFPSNDFGGQEPGSEAEIKKFCEMKFKVSFPMFSKVTVKGSNAHRLYALLQKEAGAEVKWNFGKFLVGKNGKVIRYFASNVEPGSKEIESAVEGALGQN